MYRITPRRGGGTPSGCNHQPMSNTYFAFKQFTIFHDKCAMKVGTDGVLLGAWANVTNANRILDAGTGTGLIAIMLAQRSEAVIDAVEIDENACRQAAENVASCPWKERIRVHCDSFQHYAGVTPVHYDAIVSNPPFFSNSLKPPVKSRSLARHNEHLNYESLLFFASRLLAEEGRLVIIVPAGEIERVTDLAYFHNLFPSARLKVRPVSGKAYSRCLAEFTRNRNQICTDKELVIKQKDTGQYTDDYIALTSAYYLNF